MSIISYAIRFISLWAILFASNVFYAQDFQILKDSIQVLNKEAKVELYLRIAKKFYTEQLNVDSTLKYSKIAASVSNKLDYSEGLIKSYSYIGATYTLVTKFDSTLFYYKKAKEIAEDIKDISSLADLNYKTGVVYLNQNQPEVAYKYFLEGLSSFEEKNDANGMANCYIGLSNSYVDQDQPQKRLFYIKKAIDQLPNLKEDNFFTKIQICSNAGQYYSDVSAKDSNYLDSAIQISTIGLAIAKQYKIVSRIGSFYNILAASHVQKNDNQTALLYSDSTLIYKRFLTPSLKVLTYSRLSKIHREEGNLVLSQAMLDSSYKYLPPNDSYLKKVYLYRAYHLYREKGDFKRALEFHEQYLLTNDTLRNLEKNKQINELEKKYNQTKNEKEIQALKIKSIEDRAKINLLVGSVVIVLLILIVLLVLYRQYRLRAKLNKLEAELNINQLRMNPHFLFNSLSIIQNYALAENDKLKLASYLSKYSSLMRNTLENSYNSFIKIQEEQKYLVDYIEINKLALDSDFTYEISIDEKIDEGSLLIPVLLLQPFVENAIVHGVSKVEEGKLEISFNLQNDYLIIIIKDNGKGIDHKGKESSRKSRAIQIARERLNLLEKSSGIKSEITINSSEKGTEVLVKYSVKK